MTRDDPRCRTDVRMTPNRRSKVFVHLQDDPAADTPKGKNGSREGENNRGLHPHCTG